MRLTRTFVLLCLLAVAAPTVLPGCVTMNAMVAPGTPAQQMERSLLGCRVGVKNAAKAILEHYFAGNIGRLAALDALTELKQANNDISAGLAFVDSGALANAKDKLRLAETALRTAEVLLAAIAEKQK